MHRGQRPGQVLDQMQEAEGEDRVEKRTIREIGRVGLKEGNIRRSVGIELGARDRDHAMRGIRAGVVRHMRREAQRGRAGAAADLEHAIGGAQKPGGKGQLGVVGLGVGHGFARVFRGDAVPEKGVGHWGSPVERYRHTLAIGRLPNCVHLLYAGMMNWQAVSFDWNQVRAFLATAEEGSFSGAARVLKTTQPTVGRQIGGLEEALGVTLVERSVRGLTLTEAGRDLLDHVRAMGEAATLISMVADGKSQEVTGEVTVTGTDLLSAAILPRVLKPLREAAPGIRVRILASSDMENLTQRDADIAIRHVRPDQPDLIARHLGDFRANLYAASDYLDRAGRPRTPREIADHDFVGNADPERLMAPLHNMGVPSAPRAS
jgi:molybdenum-dependent DNA-binding transcriptional regulator ModE